MVKSTERKQAGLEQHRQRIAEGQPRRSPKHTQQFEYKRHNRVFEGPDAVKNLRAAGNFIRQLKSRLSYVAVQSPRHFEHKRPLLDKKTKRVIGSVTVYGYSVSWYTRKLIGPK